jgi:hypothetical protein
MQIHTVNPAVNLIANQKIKERVPEKQKGEENEKEEEGEEGIK